MQRSTRNAVSSTVLQGSPRHLFFQNQLFFPSRSHSWPWKSANMRRIKRRKRRSHTTTIEWVVVRIIYHLYLQVVCRFYFSHFYFSLRNPCRQKDKQMPIEKLVKAELYIRWSVKKTPTHRCLNTKHTQSRINYLSKVERFSVTPLSWLKRSSCKSKHMNLILKSERPSSRSRRRSRLRILQNDFT